MLGRAAKRTVHDGAQRLHRQAGVVERLAGRRTFLEAPPPADLSSGSSPNRDGREAAGATQQTIRGAGAVKGIKASARTAASSSAGPVSGGAGDRGTQTMSTAAGPSRSDSRTSNDKESVNPAYRNLMQQRRKSERTEAASASSSSSSSSSSPSSLGDSASKLPGGPVEQLLVTNAAGHGSHGSSTSTSNRKGKGKARDDAHSPSAGTRSMTEADNAGSTLHELDARDSGGATPNTVILPASSYSASTSSDPSSSSIISTTLSASNAASPPTLESSSTAGSSEASTSSNPSGQPLFSRKPSADSDVGGSSDNTTGSSGGASSSSSGSSPSEVEFLPFVPLQAVPLPQIRHPFNTNHFVTRLEKTGEFSRGVAEEIMRATKTLLTISEDEAGSNLVAKADLENEAYLFSAALAELRTEVQMTARTDGIALRSMNSQLQREIDSLTQKLREDINTLRNDNQLDLNQRKEEASADISALEQKILDVNSKFTLVVGDTRAALEANKWIQTRRAIVMIATLAICVMAYVSTQPELPPPPPPKPPSAEELGLKQIEEPDSAETGFFSGWLTGGDRGDSRRKDGPGSTGSAVQEVPRQV